MSGQLDVPQVPVPFVIQRVSTSSRPLALGSLHPGLYLQLALQLHVEPPALGVFSNSSVHANKKSMREKNRNMGKNVRAKTLQKF